MEGMYEKQEERTNYQHQFSDRCGIGGHCHDRSVSVDAQCLL